MPSANLFEMDFRKKLNVTVMETKDNYMLPISLL